MKFQNGAQVTEVDEPLLEMEALSFRSELIFQVEFDVVAEPKALLPSDLRQLVKIYGSYLKVAAVIGASEAFVRQNSQKSIRRRRPQP